MDTFLGRTQRAFGKFSTAVCVAAAFLAAVGYLQLWNGGSFGLTSSTVANVEPRMRWHDTWRFGATDGRRKENARFTFDLDADLSPLFNWNTKQVFAYVTVDYDSVSPKTGAETSHSLVIWDKIIQDKDKANLSLKKERSKYSVYDVQSAFGGNNREVNVTVRWNVQPKIGLLVNGVIKGDKVFRVKLPPLPQKKDKEGQQPKEAAA